MPQRDSVLLAHMLGAIDRIAELAAETDQRTFDEDWVVQNAVIRELEVLGEAAGRVSSEFAAAHSEIPWREITGIRHKLIHDYSVVDLGIVWRNGRVPAGSPGDMGRSNNDARNAHSRYETAPGS